MSRQFRSDDTSKWLEGFGNGSDGDLTISTNTTESVIDASCTGTINQTTLSATNASFAAGQIIVIHKTRGNTTTNAGNWELNKIDTYTTGTITLKYPLQFTYNDSGADQSQVRVLRQYNNVTVNNGITWSGKAWDTNTGGILGFMAKGTVTITGNIIINGGNGLTNAGTTTGNPTGGGYWGGYGRKNTGSAGKAQQGEGTTGAGTESHVANGNGAGGAAGDDRTGGGGGNGAAGSNGSGGDSGSSFFGRAGNSSGAAELTTIVFGGGGGGGAEFADVHQAGSGGGGGGIVLIYAKTLSITGTITANGGAGGNGTDRAPGGGGAGGSVLIKSQTATLGSNRITATAGAGGFSVNQGGGAGGVGRIHLDYKTSYTGTTNPTLSVRQDASLDYISNNFFMFL